MSTVSLPNRRTTHITEDKSDLFTLIWLDKNCRKDDSDVLQTKTLLKEINNKNCHFYNDLDDLEKNHIFESKYLLITSGSYFETILNTYLGKKLFSLIIFCNDQNKYKEYSNLNYVIGICTDHNSLKILIDQFLCTLKNDLFENCRLNTILSLRTTSYDNTNALYTYILFIEILKQTSNISQAKDSMLNKVKNYFPNNSVPTASIESFRKDYKHEDAIEWYTKDTFIYRLVNKAFRTEDPAMWYTFRFYISDLCKQIEEVHQIQNIKEEFLVYRGQAFVPKQEFDNMISNCGGLISCNGFFSTSKSLRIAQDFLAGAIETETTQVVLFEIRINAKELKHTIFVDVAQYLPQSEEEEIIFNIGTVFQIDSYEKEDEFWRIRLHTTDECIEDIKQRIEPIQRELPRKNINLFLGELLIDMHQYEKAESYFQMILGYLPEINHPDRPLICDYLGDIQMRVKNYCKAFEYFDESEKLKEKNFSIYSQDLCITYNHLGNYYKAIDDLKTAETYYKKTLNSENSSIHIAQTKLNLSTIFVLKKKYSNARQMCLDAQKIFEQLEPIAYGEIIACKGVLGDIYLKKRQYDFAESVYLLAFEMGKKHLSIGDPRLIHCIYSLADLYHKQGRQDRALEFCREQLTIHEKYLSNTKHICIAQILLKMGDLSNEIDYYRKAMDIFNNNMGLDCLSSAKCLVKLAEFNENNQNIILYSQAMRVYRKIYPPNHKVLIKIKKELLKLKKPKRTRRYTVEENSSDRMPLLLFDQDDSEEDVGFLSTCDNICPLIRKCSILTKKQMLISGIISLLSIILLMILLIILVQTRNHSSSTESQTSTISDTMASVTVLNPSTTTISTETHTSSPKSCPIPPVNATWATLGIKFINPLGQCLDDESSLCGPRDLFIDDIHDTLYVADTDNNRIQKYSLNETYNSEVGAIGITVASTDLILPQSIFVDIYTENMYIMDFDTNRIKQASPVSYRVHLWKKNETAGKILFSEQGEQLFGQFVHCLTLDKEMNIYVGTRFYIRKWLASTNYLVRTTVAGIGSSKLGQPASLSEPASLVVTNDLTLYIADWGNKRIQKWTVNATKGTTVRGNLSYVVGITMDCNGFLYFAEAYHHTIHQLNMVTNQTRIIVGNEYDFKVSEFHWLGTIKIDKFGNLFFFDLRTVYKFPLVQQ